MSFHNDEVSWKLVSLEFTWNMDGWKMMTVILGIQDSKCLEKSLENSLEMSSHHVMETYPPTPCDPPNPEIWPYKV